LKNAWSASGKVTISCVRPALFERLAARDVAVAVVHDDFLDEIALDIGHGSEGLSRGRKLRGAFRVTFPLPLRGEWTSRLTTLIPKG
jgi:hypothetical protein